MQDQARREELASFIRHRRRTLSPATLGFNHGQNRRNPGLRREEVAAAAGVGLTWYTALEQAKPIRVSEAFLDNLVRALGFSEAERRHLFALAHQHVPIQRADPEAGAAASRLAPLLDAIQTPAYARNAHFDVLAWNAANTRIFGDFGSFAERERNVLRLLFSRAYHRRAMPDWESDARRLLANFRLNAGRAADASPFRALIAELEAESADFRRLWAEHAVGEIGEGMTHVLSPRLGAMRFRHQVLEPQGMPDIAVVVYLSADC